MTDKEKLEQYEFIDEQLTNLVESIREDGDFYIYNPHTVVSEILDWHREKVAKAKRELVEKLVEEVDDWYSLAPAYRNKSELVGKIKSLLLAELSDEEVGV